MLYIILISFVHLQIRGMSFIFESSPVCMKQYMDNIGKTSHKQEYQS